MNTKRLTVGQEVILFGIGRLLGKVISVSPTVAVQSDDGIMQFDGNGKETDACRYIRLGGVLSGPGPEWEPWEITDATPEEVAALKALCKR